MCYGCSQSLDVLTRSGVLLNLLLTNEEYWFADVTVTSSLGYSDLKITELKILRSMRKTDSRIKALDFRKADFNLL